MSADEVTIRPERDDEAAIVRHVVGAAFQRPVVPELVDALRASTAWIDGLSFVAERDGAVIGHLLLTRSRLDAPRELIDVLVLSPLAVLPADQGQGIGSQLVRHALAVAATRTEPVVFLEGSPRYYPRFGFEPGGPRGFRRPSLRIPEVAFMVYPLPAYDPSLTGTLVYAAPFWDHDCVGVREH
jgi:putative acetyltransferase